MAKFLVCANYVGEGIQGLLSEGGTSRRTVINKLAASLGGKVECLYYAFGEYDIYGIMDMPDNASMAAFTLRATSSGRVTLKSVALLTPEEIDLASKKSTEYRAPGK